MKLRTFRFSWFPGNKFFWLWVGRVHLAQCHDEVAHITLFAGYGRMHTKYN